MHIRPFAIRFIQAMSEFYDIAIFTASQKEYADTIIDIID